MYTKPDKVQLWQHYNLTHDDLGRATRTPEIGKKYILVDGWNMVTATYIRGSYDVVEWKAWADTHNGIFWEIKEVKDGNGN